MYNRANPYKRKNRDIFDEFFEDIFFPERGTHQLDIFDEFEQQFRSMQQRMNNLYGGTIQDNLESPKENGPRVYGWTYRVGPDRKPSFQEFGNVPNSPYSQSEKLEGSREPLVDVQDGEKEISVIAEIPGVSKDDVYVELTTDTLILRVDTPEHRYYKEISLTAEVDEESNDAKFNNGVLCISLKKLKPKKKGKKLKIE